MTIPASQFVGVRPSVLNAGGAGLVLNGLFLTENLAMPTGTVLSFPSTTAVAAFFGLSSTEAAAAAIYFEGYTTATLAPSSMLFAAFNLANRAGFINSGSWLNTPLATLTALAPGTLTVTIAGTPETSASINLSGATSFSNAASLILAGFTSPAFTVAFSATTGQFVITSTATGAAETVIFPTGALAAGLLFTQATGAILSQGAALDTPNSAMTNAWGLSQNWETMVTLFEPNLANKELFAAWFTAQNDSVLWLAWDSDTQASVSGATEPFGVVALTNKYDGVACIGGDPAILNLPSTPAGTTLAQLVMNTAIFVAGAIASIDFSQTNGRTNLTFLSQAGLLPACANQQTYQNLVANGYSTYGAVSTRNQGFTFFTNSNMPGDFSWIDTYVGDAWLSDQLQVSNLTLLTTIGSLAYQANGYGALRTSLVGGPIAAALNFGQIRTGVQLSSTQISDITSKLGAGYATLISTQGYYLQIADPGATVRQQRGTPVVNLFYTDGGSIQQINMGSIDLL